MPHRKSAIMIKKVWPGWLKILATLEFTADTVYYGGIFLKHHQFFLEVSSWAPVCSGSNRQCRHKDVEFWFGSVSIVFMT